MGIVETNKTRCIVLKPFDGHAVGRHVDVGKDKLASLLRRGRVITLANAEQDSSFQPPSRLQGRQREQALAIIRKRIATEERIRSQIRASEDEVFRRQLERHGYRSKIVASERDKRRVRYWGRRLSEFRTEHGNYPDEGFCGNKTNFYSWAGLNLPEGDKEKVGITSVADTLKRVGCFVQDPQGKSDMLFEMLRLIENYSGEI